MRTEVGPPDDGTTNIESMLPRLAGISLLGTGAIHAAFVGPHLSEHLSHGLFFAVVAVVQVMCGLALCWRSSRRVLGVAAAFSGGVIAVWVVSRTVGIDGVAEPVGLADSVASALEGVVVVTAIALAVGQLGQRRLPPVPAGAAFGAAVVAVVALTVPSVAYGPAQQDGRHEHGQSPPAAALPDAHGGTAHSISTRQAPAHDMAGMSHKKRPCPDPTPQQRAAADRLIQDTKTGTARLANVETAKAEGYMRFGDGAIAGTWHYINWKYQADPQVLNPEHPESIVYWQATPTSPLLLIGVMYVTPRAGDVGPEIGGCLTQWHIHGEPFAPEGVPTPEMLHTWFVPLPGGPFVTDPGHPDE